METTIIKAGPADLGMVKHITRNAFSLHSAQIGKRPAPVRKDWKKAINLGGVDMVLVDEEPVGVMLHYAKEGHWYISVMAVEPDVQGLGVGQLLNDHAEQCARDQGYDTILLNTHEKLVGNLQFWRHMGYMETDRILLGDSARVFFVKRLHGTIPT